MKGLHGNLIIIAHTLGITKETQKEVWEITLAMLSNHFSDFSIREIRYAFELAIARKLEVDLSHYNTFTPQYLSDLLIAYKQYRTKAEIALKKEIEKNAEPKPISDDEKKQFGKNALIHSYNEYKKSGEIMNYGDSVYSYMIEEKIISLSLEDKMKLMVDAKEELRKNPDVYNTKKSVILNYINAIDDMGRDEKGFITKKAKEIAIRRFFDNEGEKFFPNFAM